MAALDTQLSSRRRNVNHQLPLVPFIDFLLCLVAFLLATAVYSEMASLDADARVPSADRPSSPPSLALHVDARPQRSVRLSWREGDTVIDSQDVSFDGETLPTTRLRESLAKQWSRRGTHRSAADQNRDRAIVHTRNNASFGDMTQLIDAIRDVKKPHPSIPQRVVSAFSVSLAID